MKPEEACRYHPGDVVSMYAQFLCTSEYFTHLTVSNSLPTNHVEVVSRVFKHFGISFEQDFRAEKLVDSLHNLVPIGVPVKLFELLVNYVELGKPAQKSHLRVLMEYCGGETKTHLQQQIDENLETSIKNFMSILDYLEKFPDIKVPFKTFFLMLPQMRTREVRCSFFIRHDTNKLPVLHLVFRSEGPYVLDTQLSRA
jgi:cytochrome P450/NADPH-cytochrome P450 reductase